MQTVKIDDEKNVTLEMSPIEVKFMHKMLLLARLDLGATDYTEEYGKYIWQFDNYFEKLNDIINPKKST